MENENNLSEEMDFDAEEEISEPFNTSEISIESKKVTLDTCLRRLVQGSILLNPDFQRQEVWTPIKKSQLIESLLLKIPLPAFYVSADAKGNYIVVDGLQRLATIRSFILGDAFMHSKEERLRGQGISLEGLEFEWADDEGQDTLTGKQFNSFPVYLQNRILETEFTFIIINPSTPEEIRRNIFKRINTGGVPLSSQEIRNALYVGASTQLLKKLANNPPFKQMTRSIKDKRMEDKGLILRFLAFLIRPFPLYTRTISSDKFLSDTMILMNGMPHFNTKEFIKANKKLNIPLNQLFVKDLERIEAYFKEAMERSLVFFGSHAFRKSHGRNKHKPLNKALFEIWGVVFAKMTPSEFEQLMEHKDTFMDAYAALLQDRQFELDISRDSMKQASVERRFHRIDNLIKQFT